MNVTLAKTRLFGTLAVVSVGAPQLGVVELHVKFCQFDFYFVVSNRAYTVYGLFWHWIMSPQMGWAKYLKQRCDVQVQVWFLVLVANKLTDANLPTLHYNWAGRGRLWVRRNHFQRLISIDLIYSLTYLCMPKWRIPLKYSEKIFIHVSIEAQA